MLYILLFSAPRYKPLTSTAPSYLLPQWAVMFENSTWANGTKLYNASESQAIPGFCCLYVKPSCTLGWKKNLDFFSKTTKQRLLS